MFLEHTVNLVGFAFLTWGAFFCQPSQPCSKYDHGEEEKDEKNVFFHELIQFMIPKNMWDQLMPLPLVLKSVGAIIFLRLC